jgi:hypothetical protein
MKIGQQDCESSINGFGSSSYKFTLTAAWGKWKKKSTKLITTTLGSCLHPQFPKGIPGEKSKLNPIHTNMNHIHTNIQYTPNKEGTVLDTYLSILLNMIGLPTCIPQVAITKHEPMIHHQLSLYHRSVSINNHNQTLFHARPNYRRISRIIHSLLISAYEVSYNYSW